MLLKRRRLDNGRSTCPTVLKIAVSTDGKGLYVLEKNCEGCEAAERKDTTRQLYRELLPVYLV